MSWLLYVIPVIALSVFATVLVLWLNPQRQRKNFWNEARRESARIKQEKAIRRAVESRDSKYKGEVVLEGVVVYHPHDL